MKRNHMLVLWLFAVLMVCAVISGGCGGGSSSNDSSGGEEFVLDVNDNTSGDGRQVDGWEELNGFEVLDGRRWEVSNFQVSCPGLEKWEVVFSDEGYDLDIEQIYDTKVVFSVSDYSNVGGTEQAKIAAEFFNYADRGNICTLRAVVNGKTCIIRKVPFIGGGMFTRYGQIFMTDPSSGSYYMIDMKSSSVLSFITTLHFNNDTIPNLQITTTLQSK